ncbi:SAM hydrolase/SAM-dependent halogenase family protein [Halochromatium glycolicum]|uniref:SAM-dependent chlorinase/fluorinase n=1 Tax=Halochromatium glycolicum TaxID=85075 RepID=A0AAJ0U0Z2_9GAMM|nr:SAM-dependent chlorinase/fluorinase [Halochromatium glycolicum]MBK1703238.1 hypothetical protein [Halochromatium glycolicum]
MGSAVHSHRGRTGTGVLEAGPERVALLTDFGAGPYVGQMQLLLNGLAPDAPVVSLIADLPAFRADLSGYLLAGLARRMPGRTLYACVVDPGVGTDRDVLMMRCGEDWWLAPDNGLLVPLLRRHPEAEVFRVSWRPDWMSATFHGRDLFMPLAARLVNCDWPDCAPVAVEELVNGHWPADIWQVCYIDGFGNLILGVDADRLTPSARLKVGGQLLSHARTFAEVAPGDAFWYRDAFGLVELAVNQGRADERLGLGLGDTVALHAQDEG